MKNAILGCILFLASANPAAALVFHEQLEGFIVEDLEFVADTQIPTEGEGFMSLCHSTRGYALYGFDLTDDVVGYVLGSNRCSGPEFREFSAEQMATAQSLSLIGRDIPVVATNGWERNMRTYGLLAGVSLLMIYVILRTLRSLFGATGKGPMRKRAASRVLSALCHAAKCDGLVSSREITVIGRTMTRLTRQTYASAQIMRLSDRVHVNLDFEDYVAFGKGLRDYEKEVMLKGVLYITMEGSKMLPVEYKFATDLAHGLGIPAEDFRRILYEAFADMEANPI